MEIRAIIFGCILVLCQACCDQVDCNGLTGFEFKGYERDSLKQVMVYRYDTASNFTILIDSALLNFEKTTSSSKVALLTTSNNMDYNFLLHLRGLNSHIIKVKVTKVDFQECIKGCDPFKFPVEVDINGFVQTNRSSIVIINKQ